MATPAEKLADSLVELEKPQNERGIAIIKADDMLVTMKSAGYDVRETDPFMEQMEQNPRSYFKVFLAAKYPQMYAEGPIVLSTVYSFMEAQR